MRALLALALAAAAVAAVYGLPTHNLDTLDAPVYPEIPVDLRVKEPREVKGLKETNPGEPMAAPGADAAPRALVEQMTGCTNCGYTAPFLSDAGGGEAEEVMNQVLNTAKKTEFATRTISDITFEPQGEVPPQHVVTMSRAELVQALEGLDMTFDAAEAEAVTTAELRGRLVELLSTATPTPTPTPAATPTPTASPTFTPTPSFPTPTIPPTFTPTPTETPEPPPPSSAASASSSFTPSLSETHSTSLSPSFSLSTAPTASLAPAADRGNLQGQGDSSLDADAASAAVSAGAGAQPTPTPTPTPTEAPCDHQGIVWGMVVVAMHVVVGFISFLVQRVNPNSEDDAFFREFMNAQPGSWSDRIGEVLDVSFNAKALSHARQLMQLIPPAATIMVYITFRACAHGLPPDDGDYASVKTGFALYTAGMALMVLDALGVRVDGVCGNLNESVGTIAVTGGYAVMMWGITSVRDDTVSQSTAEVCIIAMAGFVLGCVLLMMFVRFGRPLMKSIGSKGLGLVNELTIESQLDEIMSTCSYAPLLMATFAYVDLHHMDESVEPVNRTVNQSMAGGTAGVYLLGLATLGRYGGPSTISRISLIFRVFMLMMIYSTLMMVVYVYIAEKPKSQAAMILLGLVCATSIVKATMLFIQDATHSYLDDVGKGPASPSPGRLGHEDKAQNLVTLLKDMMGAVGLTSTFVVVLLVIHFRAVVLDEQDADDWINSKTSPSLTDCMRLAVAGVIIQMLAMWLGHVTGNASTLWPSIQAIGLFLFYIGLLVCVDYAVQF